MAYVFSTSQSSQAALITNIQVPMPDHQTGDLVVYFSSTESGAGTTSGAGSTGAWTAITGTGHVVHTDATSSCFYRIMTSSSEVLFLTTTDGSTQFIVCIRDANVADPFDSVTPIHASVAASVTPVSAAVTPNTADCLVLYFISNGSVAAGQVHSPPGVMTIGSADSTGAATAAGTAGAAWYFQRASGVATPTPTWFASSSVTYSRCTFVIKQLSGGTRIPAYIDDVSSPAELLHPGFTISTTNWGGGNVTMTASLTNPANTVQIKAVNTTFAAAAVLADTGINPYANAIGSAAQTASSIFYGYEITYSTARDASAAGSIIMGAFIASTPKVASYGIGNQNQGGGVFRIASSTTAHATYQILSKDSRPNSEGRYIFGVQAGYTGSAMSDATQGTAVTTSAITANQIFCNFPSFTGRLLLCELYIAKTHVVAGGDPAFPVNTSSMVEIGKSFRLPVIQQQGGSGLLSFVPIQIGGGDAVNFQLNGGVLQFPKRYDANTLELFWHAADNAVGISYYGKSGDTIKHTNSNITSATPFYWEIHSSATSAASWDFTGLSIYNGTVTLRVAANAGFNQMSFTSCPVLTATSCSIAGSAFNSNPSVAGTSGVFTSCTFTSNTLVTATSGTLTNCTLTSNPTVTAGGTTISGTNFTSNTTVTNTTATITDTDYSGNATIALSGSTVSGSTFTALPVGNSTISVDASTAFTSCSFNTTTLTAGNAPIVTTFAIFDGLFTSCAFTGSSGGGHAVQVTTTGTTSFVGNTFTSYGADGTTSAAFYNNSGGLITLNISGGGTIPTVRNGASATTTINNNKTITITVRDESGNTVDGARVAVYKTSDMTEIMNTTTSGGVVTKTDYNYVSDTAVTIRVRKSSAATKYIATETSGTISSTGLTTTVTFVAELIAEATTDADIGGDFTVNTTTKTIRHVLGETPIYTVKKFYTWLMDYFDDSGLMDDTIPMTAQTPSEYTLTNGWFLDDTSTQFLKEGAIQTSGWTHPTNTTGIRILTLASITGVDATDLGTAVAGVTTGDTGKLVDYNVALKKLWVRTDAADDDFNNTSEDINVNGSLAGAMGGAVAVTGETIRSNIFTIGTLVSGTTTDLYQNDAQITPFWSSGHIDVLVKVKEASVETDTGNLTVLARKYGTLYDHYVVDASTGRNPVPLAAFTDDNNATAEGTVSGYSDITITFGATSQDIGNGAKPYDVLIDCVNNRTVAQAYEYLKYVTRHDSATTLNGASGEFYQAVGDIRFTYTTGSGTISQGNTITDTTSGATGYITSRIASSNTLVVTRIHGTFSNTDSISSGGATGTINSVPDSISPSKQSPFGTFAGGRFFGARGVFLVNMSDPNNYQLIDSTNTADIPPVTATVTITVKDTATPPVVVASARVLVLADTGGPMPSNVTLGAGALTRSGGTATVSHTAHGMATNDKVQIKGANEVEYNGIFTITKIDDNSYSYTVSGAPASPATGTIKATYVVLSGVTNGSGLITMSRVFSSNQPIVGKIRKSSFADTTKYKTSNIVGTIDSTAGYATTIQLISDE